MSTITREKITTGRTVKVGEHELVFGESIEELRDCNALLADVDALRARMEEDGYLLIHGFHKREQVLAARHGILEHFAANGIVDSSRPLMDGFAAEGKSCGMLKLDEIRQVQAYMELIESPKLMQWFTHFLGGESMTFDHKWVRATGKGLFTSQHYDIVYMGRGTQELYTCWTPLGDLTLDMGPLLVCLGSRDFNKLRETYGKMDVDRDNIVGGFSDNPHAVSEKFGGRWATAEFAAGDVMIFGMFLMHGSLENITEQYRISCDTRYQLTAEAVDERWVGEKPIGHYRWNKDEASQVTMADARQAWGV